MSDEWIAFTHGGRQYRAQLAETGLIVEARRYVCTKPHNMFDPPARKDWKPSEPPVWDAVSFRHSVGDELRHALESACGIRGRDEYKRRCRYARGSQARNEKAAEAWVYARAAVTVQQGRILNAAAYKIIDAGAWLLSPYETVERLYWHKCELAACQDPGAPYTPWVDLKTWILWALKTSRRRERWVLWRAAVAEVEREAVKI